MSVFATHNAGFFSCCSVKLTRIVEYINYHSKIPDYVDSSIQFDWYKKDKTRDVTYDFFEHYDNNSDVIIHYPINYHWDHQFLDYSSLDYNHIIPLIHKYFSPSKSIIKNVEYLEQKYQIDYPNTIAVYYRGTDKTKETKLASFETFYDKICEIHSLDRNKKIIIQTDTTQFVEYINNKKLENVFFFTENCTSSSINGIHLEKTHEENYNDMFYLFPIFLILSKCKYIICGTGNVSEWIMLYRGNSNNVQQYREDAFCGIFS